MTTGPSAQDKRIDWAEVRRRMQRADAAIQEALHPSAERAKAVMDARARALAQVATAAAPREAPLDVVLFRLGAERYAIETRCVREVLRFVDFTPVPGTPEFVIGVTNLRGSVLAVIDLRVLFHITQKGLTDLSRVLVLGKDGVEFGVVVDHAEGQTELPVEDLLDRSESVGIQQTHLRGVTRYAVIVLDGEALLRDERLHFDQA